MNEKFNIYLKLLEEYNEKVNLVSSADPETVIAKHINDSLAISRLSNIIDFSAPLNIIDIGIGGGFPGMPIIIEYPAFKLCAIDSVGKKLNFIKLLSEELKITDRVEIITTRAEELARIKGKRENFDIAVIRAVAKLNVISEYCMPFVKVGGYFVAYKAKNIEEELKEADYAISELGGEVVSVMQYTLSSDEERNLVVIKKIRAIADKYPRKTGIPAKSPLLPKTP